MKNSLFNKFTVILMVIFAGMSAPVSNAQSSDVEYKLAKSERVTLSDGTFLEAITPCTISVKMVDGQIDEMTVTAASPSAKVDGIKNSNTSWENSVTDAKVVEILTNKAIHTTSNSVTTIWDDVKGQETLQIRLADASPLPRLSFQVMDGPRVSDVEFYTKVLNLLYPGMEEVRRAVDAKDFVAARTAYVKYLKTRENPKFHFDWRGFDQDSSRIKDYDTSAADKIASNLLESCGVPYQFGDHVNWAINPTSPYYVEWTWQLSRHPFWRTLGNAYWATGDEKYAKAFVNQLRSWIIDSPRPDDSAGQHYSRWRTIECGIRAAGSWPESFFRFLGSPSFDDESIVMMVKAFYEHGVHLESFPSGGNWLTMEMNGLYHISVLFPEFKAASRWEKISSETLLKEQTVQFLGDWAQVELAPGYHDVSLGNIYRPLPLAAINGKKLPGDYVSNLEKMYEYYMNIALPDGRSPAVNDSYWYSSARSALSKGYALFPHRKDFLYVATEGKEGVVPSVTSVWMPWAGWYNMRSSWDSNALHAHFDVGPFSGWHSHDDVLSLLLYANGSRLLTECGKYEYDTSDWRVYCISARGHNVARVDGMDQAWKAKAKNREQSNKAPMTNRWISNENFDFGEGWYREGYGEKFDSTVTQYRALLFLKDRCWLMFDIFTPKDAAAHTYETFFHMNEAESEVNEALCAVTGSHKGVTNLSIIPMNAKDMNVKVVCGENEPEMQGWVHDERCGVYGGRPIATPIFKRKAAGQVVEPYVLYPVKDGEAFPVSSIKSKGAGKYVVTFTDGAVLKLSLTTTGDALGTLSYSIKGGKGKSVSEKVF